MYTGRSRGQEIEWGRVKVCTNRGGEGNMCGGMEEVQCWGGGGGGGIYGENGRREGS